MIKIKNLSNEQILEVDKKSAERYLRYPDLFVEAKEEKKTTKKDEAKEEK